MQNARQNLQDFTEQPGDIRQAQPLPFQSEPVSNPCSTSSTTNIDSAPTPQPVSAAPGTAAGPAEGQGSSLLPGLLDNLLTTETQSQFVLPSPQATAAASAATPSLGFPVLAGARLADPQPNTSQGFPTYQQFPGQTQSTGTHESQRPVGLDSMRIPPPPLPQQLRSPILQHSPRRLAFG